MSSGICARRKFDGALETKRDQISKIDGISTGSWKEVWIMAINCGPMTSTSSAFNSFTNSAMAVKTSFFFWVWDSERVSYLLEMLERTPRRHDFKRSLITPSGFPFPGVTISLTIFRPTEAYRYLTYIQGRVIIPFAYFLRDPRPAQEKMLRTKSTNGRERQNWRLTFQKKQ